VLLKGGGRSKGEEEMGKGKSKEARKRENRGQG